MLNSVKKLYHEIRPGGKTRILLFTFFLFVFLDNVSAQAPSIQWQKSLGGSSDDRANAIQQTTDGGYVVAGYSRSTDVQVSGNHGGLDYWIVKLNSIGNIQWQKSLGGSGYDEALAIEQTTDGGYIVAGYTASIDGDVTGNHSGGNHTDYWIVKLDSAGNMQWQKSLGGSGDDAALAVQQTTDRGYIIAGESESTDGDVTGNHIGNDYWIVKLDSTGVMQWQKSLGGSYDDEAYAIQQTTEGGFIVAGSSFSNDADVTFNHGGYDYWIVKLDSTGNIQWQKSLGGSGADFARSIQQTTDGQYVVTGWSGSTDGDVTGNHGGYDYWIVKLNSTGNIQWQKSLGGTDDDEAWAIRQTTDRGYIVAGMSGSTDGDVTNNHGIYDYWIAKLDSTGSIQWQKSLGGSGDDRAQATKQTSDGGYIVAGISLSTDGDVTGNHGIYDYWIVKLSPAVGIPELSASENSFSIYPNPCNGAFTVSGFQFTVGTTINVFNTLGEMVYSQTLNRSPRRIRPSADKQETVNCKLNAGIYFVEVKDGEKLWVKKLMVE